MTAVYTVAEIAAMLGLNRKTVYEAAERREIPHRRVGRRLLFPRVAVDAWLAGDAVQRSSRPDAP